MKISQPFVLLLGGLLSASGIGCSAFTPLVRDSRPAARESQGGSAERLVAIGRVFENQGRHEQAEAMYRRALKQKPRDTAIRSQLQQLADRRKGRQFDATTTKSAIAMADSVSGSDAGSHRTSAPDAGRATISQTKDSSANADASTAESVAATLQPVAVAATAPTIVKAIAADVSPPMTPASNVTQASETLNADANGPVTADQILVVIDDVASHSDLLIRGMTSGDSLETQCLAATLLGDCDPGDNTVRDFLAETAPSAVDDRLRMAIAASRLQRGEADQSTAGCLISLLESGNQDLRVQSATELRHFAGTECHDECVVALRCLLSADIDSIRAAAALTLGDFQIVDPETKSQLQRLAAEDSSLEVRDAASTAIGRTVRHVAGDAQAMIVTPRK